MMKPKEAHSGSVQRSGTHVEQCSRDLLVIVEHAVEGAVHAVVDEVHRVRLLLARRVHRHHLTNKHSINTTYLNNLRQRLPISRSLHTLYIG